jgi:hypothetical protein
LDLLPAKKRQTAAASKFKASLVKNSRVCCQSVKPAIGRKKVSLNIFFFLLRVALYYLCMGTFFAGRIHVFFPSPIIRYQNLSPPSIATKCPSCEAQRKKKFGYKAIFLVFVSVNLATLSTRISPHALSSAARPLLQSKPGCHNVTERKKEREWSI